MALLLSLGVVRSKAAWLVWCWSLQLAAQGTFIVDIANGPGTNYTQINAAAASVPSGSILLVRAGLYSPVDIDKALTVLCEPQVHVGFFGYGLRIRNTTAGQTVFVRGLQPYADSHLEVISAAGLVVLDGAGGDGGRLEVVASSQVIVRNYWFAPSPVMGFSAGHPAVRVLWGSTVVLDSCTVRGQGLTYIDGWFYYPTNAMTIGAIGDVCRVQVAHCLVTGGLGGYITNLGLIPISGAPAVQLGGGSSFRALGISAHRIEAGGGPSIPGSFTDAVVGAGIARLDAMIQVLPAPVSSPSLLITRPIMPSVVTDGGTVGGTIAVRRYGASGIPVAIAVGYPAPPSPWLQQPDPLWLDLTTASVEAFAISPVGPMQLTFAIPNVLALRGLTVVWHAADFEVGGGVSLSNPSAITIY